MRLALAISESCILASDNKLLSPLQRASGQSSRFVLHLRKCLSSSAPWFAGTAAVEIFNIGGRGGVCKVSQPQELHRPLGPKERKAAKALTFTGCNGSGSQP